MDRLPEIPTNKGENDTICVLKSVFQENIEANIFPLDIAENITKYIVDDDLSLQATAQNVLEINEFFVTESDKIKGTELEIIKEHGEYLINKNLIDQNIFLRELSKLKSCDIFNNIHPSDVENYGLIQKCDLYPDLTRQFLDFRFNTTLHQCKKCFSAIERKNIVFKDKIRLKKQDTQKFKKETSQSDQFKVEPAEIVFSNFETKLVYEQTVKIINTSSHLQTICSMAAPKLPVFTLFFECKKIAAGMSINAKIRFTPDIKLNLQDEVVFKSGKGLVVRVPIKCERDPPKLFGYIHKSNTRPNLALEQHVPGTIQFSKSRRTAVNDTIDCGSCFVTDHVLITMFLINNGTSARFFLISEEDFFNENINNISTSLEFYNENFWIYPTYFEISKGQTSELNIIFQPMHCGLHIQNLFIMCDNNTYKQIEIVGDSICFNKNMISVDIPYTAKEIEKNEGHCIFLGYAINKEKRFTLCIKNRSSIFLKYYFKFEIGDEFDMTEWIKITNRTSVLAPYSDTDIIFLIRPDNVSKSGYYTADLRLFMEDIPIASLNETETFFVTTNMRQLEKVVENLSVVDVLVMDVSLACHFETEQEIPEKQHKDDDFECSKCCKKPCSCENGQENIPLADLVFSESLLDMGILPTGINIKKDFYVMNVGENKVKWKIAEIKYDITTNPHVEVISDNNLSQNFGTLWPGKKQPLSYKIVKKQPTRWVSILVIFSVLKNENKDQKGKANKYTLVAESICIVTYEIINLNIVIKTGSTEEPILCPLEMLYTGVPVRLSLKIFNFSLISGCFYFLKPIGKDAEKVQVQYEPQFGELQARSERKIYIEITCNDVGILENIFLPCFVGHHQKLIMVRLLCVVDCIHVHFYLPNKNNQYQKILWPPKVLYEYDRSWSQYCICEELSEEYENTVQNIQSEHESQILQKSSQTLNDINTSNIQVNDQSKADSATQSGSNLLKTLVNVDSEIYLQDYIMEVENLEIKKPRKIIIYMETLNPRSVKYTIQSTNYSAKENLIEDALTTTYKTTEELWEPMLEKYGILVHPEIESGTLEPHELLSANIWIYANTWGIYAEEIVIDIEDIACFTFSVIIEVVGCPVQIPLSLGAITKYPTVRFGSVTFGNDNLTRNIVISNTSSIDVNISWHMFYFCEECENETLPPFNFICDVIETSENKFEFDFTERFFGIEEADCVEVIPTQLNLSSNCKTIIPIIFKPSAFRYNDQKRFIKCYILGRIFMAEEDRLKSSYFYRKYNSLVIEVTANVEKPHLDITAEADDNTLYVYANEVTLNREAEFYMELIVRNNTSAITEAILDCTEPFSIPSTENKITLNPGQCQKIKVLCLLSYDKIIKWAPEVYNLTETTEYHQIQEVKLDETRLGPPIENDIDDSEKILTLHRMLFLNYKGVFTDTIPLNVCIHYPHIAVKPSHIKFGYILIGRTQKTLVSVFNLTGCKVLFEVFKSLSDQEIFVTPSYGEIDKSTGINHNFVDISIYFTPTECRNYQESIRIITNIPQYYIDIPIKGAGSFNEKFDGGS